MGFSTGSNFLLIAKYLEKKGFVWKLPKPIRNHIISFIAGPIRHVGDYNGVRFLTVDGQRVLLRTSLNGWGRWFFPRFLCENLGDNGRCLFELSSNELMLSMPSNPRFVEICDSLRQESRLEIYDSEQVDSAKKAIAILARGKLPIPHRDSYDLQLFNSMFSYLFFPQEVLVFRAQLFQRLEKIFEMIESPEMNADISRARTQIIEYETRELNYFAIEILSGLSDASNWPVVVELMGDDILHNQVNSFNEVVLQYLSWARVPTSVLNAAREISQDLDLEHINRPNIDVNAIQSDYSNFNLALSEMSRDRPGVVWQEVENFNEAVNQESLHPPATALMPTDGYFQPALRTFDFVGFARLFFIALVFHTITSL